MLKLLDPGQRTFHVHPEEVEDKCHFEPFAWDLFAKFDSCAANAAPRHAPASAREPLQVIGGENGLIFQDTLIALK